MVQDSPPGGHQGHLPVHQAATQAPPARHPDPRQHPRVPREDGRDAEQLSREPSREPWGSRRLNFNTTRHD